MKNFFDSFFDFFSGGFFNYIGAAIRFPFNSQKFQDLAGDDLSNSIGMIATAIIAFAVTAYVFYFI